MIAAILALVIIWAAIAALSALVAYAFFWLIVNIMDWILR